MSDTAIKVENLSKRYPFDCAQGRLLGLKEELPDTFVGAMTGWLKSPLANYRQLRRLTTFDDGQNPQSTIHNPKSDDIIWALKDVSFEVKQGEVVGIPSTLLRTSIGRNGAGKSTLLKILSRITEPTGGRAIINGRPKVQPAGRCAGTGFHSDPSLSLRTRLTGRDAKRVYLNGTVPGMTKTEIDRKFDEIVLRRGRSWLVGSVHS